MLKQILSGKDNLTEIENLNSVPTSSLFESELERRLVEALAQMGNDNRTVSISKELVNGKEGFLLKINDAIWEIEPQVVLDRSSGVSVSSRADFVFWPARTDHVHRPVAVFTDGFRYHKNTVADDTLKRDAILLSKRFRVWTLSWKDVQNVFSRQDDYATDTLIPEKMPSGVKMYKPTVESILANESSGMNPGEDTPELHPYKASAMELFINYLEYPDAERLFNAHARAYAFSLLDMTIFRNSASFADWNMNLSGLYEACGILEKSFEFGNTFFGTWSPRSVGSQMTVYSGVHADSMQKHKTRADISVYALLNDNEEERSEKYEAEWNGFWQFVNMMQFFGQLYSGFSQRCKTDGLLHIACWMRTGRCGNVRVFRECMAGHVRADH